MYRWLPVAMLVACASSADPDDDRADDAPIIDPADFTGAPLAQVSDDICPRLTRSGTVSFSSGGRERELEVHLPDVVEPGLPVIFVWHGLGDSAASMSGWMGLGELARDAGAVVLVPDSIDRSQNTWDILGNGGADVVLFDDLRTCLSQQLEVDLARITSAGFSFGGLWTTWLTIHRGDTFATTMPMSGGTDGFFVRYDPPAHTMPVLLMWGGAGDLYGSGPTAVDFEATTLDFSDRLRSDGHFVVQCDHGLGHNVPPDVRTTMADWLGAHTYGEPSPFAESVDGLPAFCSAP